MVPVFSSGRIFIHTAPIDGRLAHRGLSFLVTHVMEHDLLDGDTFVFISGSRRAAKVLIFDGTGLLLLHKKLEVGLFMKVSKSQKLYELSPKALEQILGGSNVVLGYSLLPK